MSRVWLIGNADSALGLFLTRSALAAEYAVIAITSDSQRLRRTLDEQYGGASDLYPLEADTGDQWQIVGAVEQGIQRFGGIDVLVNNVQTACSGYFEELSAEDYQNAISGHVLATINLTQAVLPCMRAQRFGQVINFGASLTETDAPQCTAVNAAGFAVEGLSRSLAEEMRPFGVFVSCIKPQVPGIEPSMADAAASPGADHIDAQAAADRLAEHTGDEKVETTVVGCAIEALLAMATPPGVLCVPPADEIIEMPNDQDQDLTPSGPRQACSWIRDACVYG